MAFALILRQARAGWSESSLKRSAGYTLAEGLKKESHVNHLRVDHMAQRILVAVDGSEASDKALEYAIQLAKQEQADLTVLAVVEPEHPQSHMFPTEYTSKPYNDAEKNRLEQVLKEGAKKANNEAPDVPLEMKLLFGRPGEEIVKECTEGAYKLVVVGSRGIGGIKGIILGSVSKSVADMAPCPVLIVK